MKETKVFSITVEGTTEEIKGFWQQLKSYAGVDVREHEQKDCAIILDVEKRFRCERGESCSVANGCKHYILFVKGK